MAFHPDDWQFAQNPADYAGPYPHWMDARHVSLLHDLLLTGRFKRVLEIGCWDGFSTAGLVSAINEGADVELHLCDIQFRPALFEVARRCERKISFHNSRSHEVIQPGYDLVIIDGDHGLPCVTREYELLVSSRIPSFVAHDIQAGHIPGCEGPQHFSKRVRQDSWYFREDCQARQGEWTECGLLFATRDLATYQAVMPVWRTMLQDRPAGRPAATAP